jgi:hypothetical protein
MDIAERSGTQAAVKNGRTFDYGETLNADGKVISRHEKVVIEKDVK